MSSRVNRATKRVQRVVDMLGLGDVSDEPQIPSMLTSTLKTKDYGLSKRAQRAQKRARMKDDDWEQLGFRPKKMKDEEIALEKERALNYVEALPLVEEQEEGVVRLFRWLRPGVLKLDLAKLWLMKKGPRPRWTQGFGDQLSLDRGRLKVAGLPVLSEAELRKQIKKTYFTAKLPSTVEGVFQHLRSRIANASRKQVDSVMKSLRTFQLLRPRRVPMKNEITTMVLKPGRIGQDSFFPSKKYWDGRKYPITVLADQWSGYTKAFLMGSEKAAYSYYALKLFIQELQSMGVQVHSLLTDKGSEMQYDAQLTRDFPRIRHMSSPTGNVIAFIEAKVKLIQSRLWIARTAYDGRTLTIADILDDVLIDINSTKRPTRGNLSPIDLLKITPKMRSMINVSQRNSIKMVSNRIHGLPDLFKGDIVRVTRYTRKQQEHGGLDIKWFRPKWSDRLYTVVGARAVANGRLKYKLAESNQFYWRWEMLKVDPDVDAEVPPFDAPGRAKLITKQLAS